MNVSQVWTNPTAVCCECPLFRCPPWRLKLFHLAQKCISFPHSLRLSFSICSCISLLLSIFISLHLFLSVNSLRDCETASCCHECRTHHLMTSAAKTPHYRSLFLSHTLYVLPLLVPFFHFLSFLLSLFQSMCLVNPFFFPTPFPSLFLSAPVFLFLSHSLSCTVYTHTLQMLPLLLLLELLSIACLFLSPYIGLSVLYLSLSSLSLPLLELACSFSIHSCKRSFGPVQQRSDR